MASAVHDELAALLDENRMLKARNAYLEAQHTWLFSHGASKLLSVEEKIRSLQHQAAMSEQPSAGGPQTDVADSVIRDMRRAAPAQTMFQARYMHGSCVLDGQLFVVGGSTGSAIGTVEKYDAYSNQWTKCDDMAGARGSHAMAVAAGHMYAIGGSAGEGALSTFDRYDAVEDAWIAMTPSPTERAYLSAVSVDDSIIVSGGCTTPDFTYIPNIDRYDPGTDTWTTLGSPVIDGDDHPCGYTNASVGIDHSVYYLGTSFNAGKSYRYDPRVPGLTFTRLASMPQVLMDFGTAATSNEVFVVGGKFSGAVAKRLVQVYDVRADRWRRAADIPVPVYSGTSTVMGDVLYAIGGSTGGDATGITEAVQRYNIAADMWY